MGWDKYIHCVRIAVPFSLRFVNCYLVRNHAGWSVIDTGLDFGSSRETWLEIFKTVELTPSQINAIYVTHFHPDHFGLAGWLQEISGAEVYMSAPEASYVARAWGDGNTHSEDMINLFARHGLPDEMAGVMLGQMRGVRRWVNNKVRITTLAAGQEVLLGDSAYQVIPTPGHTGGHVCLYSPERQILFAGDHVLPDITPNIGVRVGDSPNPLREYLASLAETGILAVKTVFPAHRSPFEDLPGRIEELQSHHAARLNLVEDLTGSWQTGFSVSQGLFGEETAIKEARFALPETLAHLAYLENENVVEKEEIEGVYYWRKA